MPRTSTQTSLVLVLSMLSPACDDPTQSDTDVDLEFDEDEDADAGFGFGEVTPRCAPEPCTDPPVSNTNWVGSNPVDTVTQNHWNVPTLLSNGKYMRLAGAWCPTSSSPYKFNATPKGELVFYLRDDTEFDHNKIRGTAVQGCKFYAQFSSTHDFASQTHKTIKIAEAVPTLRADGVTIGYKYLMTVFSDVPGDNEKSIPTCHDSLDAAGNYYLQVRPGLALNRNTWTLTADPTKQSWVCTAGAAGHFALKDVDVEDISDPTLATAEARAWGLYHHGAPHTYVGNPVRIRYAGPGVIEGYDAAPNNCDAVEDWHTEARYAGGDLLCRGTDATAWSSQISRNAWSHNQDWDNDSSAALVPVCSGEQTYQFETYARCYMNGSFRVCPSTSGC